MRGVCAVPLGLFVYLGWVWDVHWVSSFNFGAPTETRLVELSSRFWLDWLDSARAVLAFGWFLLASVHRLLCCLCKAMLRHTILGDSLGP